MDYPEAVVVRGGRAASAAARVADWGETCGGEEGNAAGAVLFVPCGEARGGSAKLDPEAGPRLAQLRKGPGRER